MATQITRRFTVRRQAKDAVQRLIDLGYEAKTEVYVMKGGEVYVRTEAKGADVTAALLQGAVATTVEGFEVEYYRGVGLARMGRDHQHVGLTRFKGGAGGKPHTVPNGAKAKR